MPPRTRSMGPALTGFRIWLLSARDSWTLHGQYATRAAALAELDVLRTRNVMEMLEAWDPLLETWETLPSRQHLVGLKGDSARWLAERMLCIGRS